MTHAFGVPKSYLTRMWANAQCDGRPAKYRWRPLFNAAVWLTPTTRVPCSNAGKTRKPLNLQGCPKLANRSQPLVDRSSPYYEDMWRRYRCLTSFFSDCRYVPQLRRYSLPKLSDGAKMAIFCVLYFQRAACSTFQTCILNSH